MGGCRRFGQQEAGWRMGCGPGRKPAARFRYCKMPAHPAGLPAQLLGRKARRAGEGLSEPSFGRHPVLSQCGAEPAWRAGYRRYLRHQPGGRRLPQHQPDHPDCARESKHGGWRLRHRGRH